MIQGANNLTEEAFRSFLIRFVAKKQLMVADLKNMAVQHASSHGREPASIFIQKSHLNIKENTIIAALWLFYTIKTVSIYIKFDF